jgi:uncharacterized membrane protein YjjP (DUF1212 family)
MKRVFTWPALALVVGVLLIAALFALINGNGGLGVSLIVMAVGEAVFGAPMVAFAQRKARSG